MSMLHKDTRFTFLGNHYTAQNGWNKKLCFEAKDTLGACVDSTENGNKFRCPDELYAYEMWCPNDFRRMHSVQKRKTDMDEQMYDKDLVAKINAKKQNLSQGKWVIA
jgi:hypothetical protein